MKPTIETDTDLVFDVCDQVVNYPQKIYNLFDDYMYMYSLGNEHFFKHTETRETISVCATLGE
jgi:hypothetical protein